ncbi:hypothetical protein Ndes2526B_g04553 [Nannochloris sp. 'desiccata']|nr:hypothetical protein KSW81_000714 [Chlorella desiccata (nom. nud.)]KAH7620631.1 putative Mitochondrial thiamine diphosphate carrier 2 [Chlorella desiccata (nom. nud.)]
MGKNRKVSSSREDQAPDENGFDMVKISMTAGALAGAVARFVVGPLDVIKIRFQVQLEPITAVGAAPSKYKSLAHAFKTIVKEEGIQALWRGTIPGQLLTIPYTAVQFMTLQHCKHIALDHGLATHSVTPFLSGALAGAAGTVASYPFDLLRTTLAAQGEPKVYAGMLDAARGIMKESGVRGLYRGMGITVLEIMPYAALQFGLYDVFNSIADDMRRGDRMYIGEQKLNSKGGRKESANEPLPSSALQSFICGLAAGALAKLGTHPLDVVKKRFQVAGLQRSAAYGERVSSQVAASFLMCLQSIAQKEGLGGFYKGAMPSLLKAAPSAAVTFACYDFFLRTLTARKDEKAAAAAMATTGNKASAPRLH